MQSRFRRLSCTAVGGADAERFSIGAEEVNYEGPLQLRLQVCTHGYQLKGSVKRPSPVGDKWRRIGAREASGIKQHRHDSW